MGYFILIGSVGIVSAFAITTAWLMRVWQADAERQRCGWGDGGALLLHGLDDPQRRAARAVQAATLDAQAACDCASELAYFATFAANAGWPRLPSARVRLQLVRERANKARDYARRAQTHAQAARSCESGRQALPATACLAAIERHAALAKQAHLNARDLREFILIGWRRDGLALPR
ncbi:hypothetical protein Bsp3421_000611 (plasmid) [Burkholderia sp. FERM BP-3421]|uniref:hypothetical protein n=1 Tax=Burkholderia sp. FERM BP-3421 TaxID=1494466 RepID=UPI00235FCE04|nr:hypothetical protein [Burkholderia sp. FERM BP-3421]WDD90740.1 hypothetical protein Bsp3421_000611 [Burkholderia sp. FERM BP-3421]